MQRWEAQDLEPFARGIFEAVGTEPDIAGVVAGHLVRSNLSGHDSHGVIRLMQYVAQIEEGEIAPSARPEVLRESGATGLIDAHRGFGHHSTAWTLDWAIERATQHGVALATIRHSTHIGRLGEYAERACDRGMIAIVTVGAAGPGLGGMVLFGGRKRFLGANPWAIGIPAEGQPPMVFDGSTSTIAEGKVRVARDKGGEVPVDSILDPEGKPTTQPADFYAGGTLVPLGGRVAGHKGYGLAMASALLGALATIDDPEPTFIGARVREEVDDPRGRVAGVFLVVIDPGAFGEAATYQSMVAETMNAAKRVPPAEGKSEVLVPGEVEVRNREERGRDGIPLPDVTARDLAGVGEKLGVAMPGPLGG